MSPFDLFFKRRRQENIERDGSIRDAGGLPSEPLRHIDVADIPSREPSPGVFFGIRAQASLASGTARQICKNGIGFAGVRQFQSGPGHPLADAPAQA